MAARFPAPNFVRHNLALRQSFHAPRSIQLGDADTPLILHVMTHKEVLANQSIKTLDSPRTAVAPRRSSSLYPISLRLSVLPVRLDQQQIRRRPADDISLQEIVAILLRCRSALDSQNLRDNCAHLRPSRNDNELSI
jgi:hypothetical protein